MSVGEHRMRGAGGVARFLSLAGRWKPGRTFAQTLAAALIADGTGILDSDWTQQLSVSGMAGLVSFLMIWAQGQTQLAEPRTDDDDNTGLSAAE